MTRTEAKASGKLLVLPYKCGSHRHAGACRAKYSGARYKRIEKTLAPIPVEELSFLVFTENQKTWRKEGESEQDAVWRCFRESGPRWKLLRQRLEREFGDLEFLLTVEAHRGGARFPHYNVIIKNKMLGAMCLDGEKGYQRPRRIITKHLVECGFGFRTTLEPIRSKERVGLYIAKMASESACIVKGEQVGGAIVGEVSKMTQVADHAPRHFRTLRSSHKFLVPVEKKEEYTGVLVDKDGVRLGRGYKARREHFDAVRERVERVERSEGAVSFGLVNVDGTIERPYARSGVESILRVRGAWMEMQAEVERDIDEFIAQAAARRAGVEYRPPLYVWQNGERIEIA